jgi:tetratricopeptide (TPR) repeat protein
MISSLRAIVVTALSFVALAASAAETPSLSEAERSAVAAAAEFLAGGPESLVPRLSASSSHRRPSATETALEIELRTGPNAGTEWQMLSLFPPLAERAAAFSVSFPSGIDDTLLFEMVREGEQWRLHRVRSLAEPVKDDASQKASPPPPPATETHFPAAERRGIALPVGVAAAFLVGISIGGRRRWPRAARAALAVSILAVGAATGAVLWPPAETDGDGAPTAATEESPTPRLVALRRALAAGEPLPSLRGLTGDAASVAALWQGQRELQSMQLEKLDKILEGFPLPADRPMVEMLRARLALLRAAEVDAALAYERAINLGPGRDALWQEAGTALSILGFEERARHFLGRPVKAGSRDASSYYTAAVIHAIGGENEKAEQSLLRGWKLMPLARANVLQLGPLWEVIRRPEAARMLQLNAEAESTVVPASLSSHPLTPPVGVESVMNGETLIMRDGDAMLVIPGGAEVAPVGATVVDARWIEQTEETRLLAEIPSLLQHGTQPGALTQPRLRRKVQAAADVLASRNRWEDVLALTASLSPDAEHIPIDLVLLRGVGMRRLGRDEEAKALWVKVAARQIKRRSPDPQTLLQLGEMLASVELTAAAIRLLEKAGEIREIPGLDERIRQLLMDQRLATSYSLHSTPNFRVRYPPDVTLALAARMGEILEAELARIRKRLPIEHFEPVTVNVVWWKEFRNTYTGGDHVLGFYNGRITLPFAGVPHFVPDVVAILSHELTHAIVAQASRDQAPRWFQEGIAMRMEMRRYAPNALNMYDDEHLLSLSVLEPVLTLSPDPDMIGEAYIEAHTVMRYLEANFGQDVLWKLVQAFGAGETAETAFVRVCGKTVAEIDRDFRAWGKKERRVFSDAEPLRYDRLDDDGIKARIQKRGGAR